MDEHEEYTELHAIHDLTESDRGFFNIVRYLDSNTRNHLVAAQMRNTNLALQILRTSISQETMVMNVPLGGLFGGGASNFLDPVPIVPTQPQILAGTEIITNAPPDTQCSICQEPITGVHMKIRQCSHRFHQTCIRQWFEVNPRCPVCRHDVREARDLQSSDSDSDNDNRVHSDEE